MRDSIPLLSPDHSPLHSFVLPLHFCPKQVTDTSRPEHKRLTTASDSSSRRSRSNEQLLPLQEDRQHQSQCPRDNHEDPSIIDRIHNLVVDQRALRIRETRKKRPNA